MHTYTQYVYMCRNVYMHIYIYTYLCFYTRIYSAFLRRLFWSRAHLSIRNRAEENLIGGCLLLTLFECVWRCLNIFSIHIVILRSNTFSTCFPYILFSYVHLHVVIICSQHVHMLFSYIHIHIVAKRENEYIPPKSFGSQYASIVTQGVSAGERTIYVTIFSIVFQSGTSLHAKLRAFLH